MIFISFLLLLGAAVVFYFFFQYLMLRVDPSMVVRACIRRLLPSDSLHYAVFLSVHAFLVHALHSLTVVALIHYSGVAVVHYSCVTLIYHPCVAFMRCAHSLFMRRIHLSFMRRTHSPIMHCSHSLFMFQPCSLESPWFSLLLDMYQVSDLPARVLRYGQDEYASRCTAHCPSTQLLFSLVHIAWMHIFISLRFSHLTPNIDPREPPIITLHWPYPRFHPLWGAVLWDDQVQCWAAKVLTLCDWSVLAFRVRSTHCRPLLLTCFILKYMSSALPV